MAEKKDGRPLAPSKSAQDKDIVIDKWRANKRELVQIKIRKFKGYTFVDIRRWYRDADGNLRPGKGICVKPEDVTRVRRALRQADRLINGGR